MAAMPFNERLKELRSAAGMTQEAVARSAGLSTSTIAKLEHAGVDPSWSTVVLIAKAIGVGVGAFESDAPKAAVSEAARANVGEQAGPRTGIPVVIDPVTGERSIAINVTAADRAGPACSPEGRRILGTMIITPSTEVDDQSATSKKGPGRPKKPSADAAGPNVAETAGDAPQAKSGAAREKRRKK